MCNDSGARPLLGSSQYGWRGSELSIRDGVMDSGKASDLSVCSWPVEPIHWTPFPLLQQLASQRTPTVSVYVCVCVWERDDIIIVSNLSRFYYTYDRPACQSTFAAWTFNIKPLIHKQCRLVLLVRQVEINFWCWRLLPCRKGVTQSGTYM